MGISTRDVKKKKKKNLRDHLWHCCIEAKNLNAHQTEVEFFKLEPDYNSQKIQLVLFLSGITSQLLPF